MKKVTHTDWHEVILWPPYAEIAAKYLQKGKQIYVEGKLSYRSYIDKEGQQRYNTQIIGQQLILLNNNNSQSQTDHIQVITHTPQSPPLEDDMGELPL